MNRQRVCAAIILVAILGSTVAAFTVRAGDGGLLPAALLLVLLTGRQLRRRTSPESRRA
jgi:hypothetical protein